MFRTQARKPGAEIVHADGLPATGVHEVVEDAAHRQGGDHRRQLVRVLEAPVSVEHHGDRSGEVELLVRPREHRLAGLVQPLLDDLDEFLAQQFQVCEVGRVDHCQPLGNDAVMEGVVAPGGEVVVVLALRELGA